MLVMSAKDINKSYGTDVILEDVSFSVNKGDRIGIVGPNGAGKTTLLRIISGELEPTSGELFIKPGFHLGYLKQRNNFDIQGTLLEEVKKSFTRFYRMEREMARLQELIKDHKSSDFQKNLAAYTDLLEKYKDAGGYTYESEMESVLANMGFGPETYSKKTGSLSGGERTRLALAALLLKAPEILLLDEPTNHLDLQMLEWLEKYLNGYKGTVIVVSHDRFFLDKMVTRVFDVRNTHLYCYTGNYTEFTVKRQERLESERRAWENQQREIKRQEEMIRRMKERGTEHLAKRAQSREKQLAQMDVLDRPESESGDMKLQFHVEYKSGNEVVTAEGLEKSFGERKLFRNVDFKIRKGEKVCIIGNNGTGKTTLLRIILGQIQQDRGYLKIGHNVNFGYYDQGQLMLDENETILGEMKNAYHLYTDTQMRSLLGRFLFSGDEVFLRVGDISGGEKARLALLKLMLSGSNTLVLDEPTNHLDIQSKEVVEEAISGFDGTVIMVSHDRYLLSRVPDRILELTPDGMIEYQGKYDYYLEKSQERHQLIESKQASSGASGGGSSAAGGSEIGTEGDSGKNESSLSAEDERRLRKEREAEERRQARKLQGLEEKIHDLEGRIEEIEKALCSPEHMRDIEFLQEQGQIMDQLKQELDEKYDQWMELQA